MLSEWFANNGFFSQTIVLTFSRYVVRLYPYIIFGWIMFALFLWASFHLITDIIMAFRAVFGFGYKKRKGGSH